MYQERFKEAVTRTKKFNLNCPEVSYSNDIFFSDEKMSKFPYVLRDAVGEISTKEVVAQCLSIHHKLRGYIAKIFNTDCYFTIGYVETSERFMFHQTEESLLNILKNGINGASLEIHAWLTLPSMEILDLSLPTSYAVANDLREGIGGVIAEHPDNLKKGLKYHPMLIGDDFLRKSGGLVEFCI